MTKDLAIVKKTYQISMSNGDKETVLLENEPNWQTMIKEKHVVVIDGITLNFSYVVSAKEVDINDTDVDSAMAYAKSLKGAMRVVAIERVRGYENGPHDLGKMPIWKLKEWLESFFDKGKPEERIKKRHTLYLSAGGDPDHLQ